jgi:hypothetical protein
MVFSISGSGCLVNLRFALSILHCYSATSPTSIILFESAALASSLISGDVAVRCFLCDELEQSGNPLDSLPPDFPGKIVLLSN